MPNYTTNLNLEKPLQGEFYNVDIFNANADKIDTVVGNISTNTYGTTTGIGNLVLNIPEFVGTLKVGTVLRFKTNSGGTGSVTLNFNGNGAKRINRSNGSQLNRVDAGAIYTVVYDGSNFILQGEGGEYGTAVASDVLQGKTIGTENGLVNGTIVNRGTFNLGLGQTVPPGYYSGGVTADGKRYSIGTTLLIGSGNNVLVNVTGLNFLPTTIVLSYNNLNFYVRKTYIRNGGDLNRYTYDSNGSLMDLGDWNIVNNSFSTTFFRSTTAAGAYCNYTAYE